MKSQDYDTDALVELAGAVEEHLATDSDDGDESYEECLIKAVKRSARELLLLRGLAGAVAGMYDLMNDGHGWGRSQLNQKIVKVEDAFEQCLDFGIEPLDLAVAIEMAGVQDIHRGG